MLKSVLKDFELALPKNSYSKMRLDIKNYLHNNILSIIDKATMAASVEGRVPLLDHNVVELSFKTPEKITLLNGVKKGLFKKSVRDLISRGILERKKDGFNAPVYSWIEQWKELIKIEFSDHMTRELDDIIDMHVVTKWLDDDKLRKKAAETLYSLYLLNYWIRQHRL